MTALPLASLPLILPLLIDKWAPRVMFFFNLQPMKYWDELVQSKELEQAKIALEEARLEVATLPPSMRIWRRRRIWDPVKFEVPRAALLSSPCPDAPAAPPSWRPDARAAPPSPRRPQPRREPRSSSARWSASWFGTAASPASWSRGATPSCSRLAPGPAHAWPLVLRLRAQDAQHRAPAARARQDHAALPLPQLPTGSRPRCSSCYLQEQPWIYRPWP